MKKFKLILSILLFSYSLLNAQSGTIKGKVLDEDQYPMPNVHVYVEVAGNKIGDVTDMDGNYTIKPLSPGKYNLMMSSIGYQDKIISGVYVKPNGLTFIKTLSMHQGVKLAQADVIAYRVPLIDPGNPSEMTTTGAELENMPDSRNLPNVIRNLSSDIQVSDGGNDIIIRGSRPGSSSYYVDGVKVDDLSSVPGTGIGSISVYSGGIPAKFGDLTGGVVVIESKTYFDFLNEHEARERKRKEMNEETESLFNIVE